MPSKGDENTEDKKGKHHKKKKKTKQTSEEFHSSSKHKQVDVDGSTKYHNSSDYEKERKSKQKRIKRKKERKITKSLRHIDSKHVEGLQKKTTLEFKENQENLKSLEQNDKKNHKSLKRKHIEHSKKEKKMKTTSSECKDNIENLESFDQNGKKKHRSSKRKHVDDDQLEQPKKKKNKSLDYNENHENLHLLDQSSKKKHKSPKRKHVDDDHLQHPKKKTKKKKKSLDYNGNQENLQLLDKSSKKKHKSLKHADDDHLEHPKKKKKKKSLDYNGNQENLQLLDQSSKKKHKSLKHADDDHLEHKKKHKSLKRMLAKKKKKSLDNNENQENLQLLDQSSKKKHKSLKHADDDHLEHKKKHKSLKRMLAKKTKKSLDNNKNQENLQLLDQSSKKKHKSLKHADDYHSENTVKKTSVEYKDHQKHQPLLDENESEKHNKSDDSMEYTTMVVESVKDQGENENKQPMQKESEIFKVNDIHLKKQELFRESRKMKLADNEYENFILDNDLIHYIWKPNKELREKLGVREGKWTKKEECQLEKNMERFLQFHNIDDPMKLINMFANDKKKFKDFQNKTGFYQELLKGLNRSISKVASKFIQFFDKKRYLGKYSKNEDEELIKLVAQGKRWTEIGIAIGRSNYSACNRHILIKDKSLHNTGPWQDDETDRLRKAVRQVTNTQEGEEVHSGINWTKVSSIVKTRHALICRRKWLYEIFWKECKHFTDEKIWSQENDVELIKRVYESQATEECDVNWFALIEYFKISCSSYWLRKKFLIIKRRYFSPIDLENKDFDEVIDHLYNVVAVDLQNKISQEQEKSAT